MFVDTPPATPTVPDIIVSTNFSEHGESTHRAQKVSEHDRAQAKAEPGLNVKVDATPHLADIRARIAQLSHIPVGGRLRLFWRRWRELGASKKVIRWIRKGYSLPFILDQSHLPPLKLMTACPPGLATNYEKGSEKQIALDILISQLLAKKVIEPVPSKQPCFFSRVFLRPKPNGSWRLILDVSELNKYVKCQTFKMDTAQVVRGAIAQGGWATSIDFSDAYHHIPMFAAHRKYLCFQVNNILYWYLALPFGLNTAPSVFTTVMKPLKAWGRERLTLLFQYLDDWFNAEPEALAALKNTVEFIYKCIELGLVVNLDKSDVQPSQNIIFLGIVFDFVTGKVQPSEKALSEIKAKIDRLLQKSRPSLKRAESLHGKIASVEKTVHLGRLHLRHLQSQIKLSLPLGRHRSTRIQLTPQVRADLMWWSHSSHLRLGVPFVPRLPTVSVQTDASTQGWGFTCRNQLWSGLWTRHESSLHINVLEMKVLSLALIKIPHLLSNQVILFLVDNTTVVSYVMKQGGTHSPALTQEVRLLFEHAESCSSTVQARFIAGRNNVVADLASRAGQVVQTEWRLGPSEFLWVVAHSVWGKPQVDWFANSLNHQLALYVSPNPDDSAWAIDGLTTQLPRRVVYAFPPAIILHKFLLWVRQSVDTCQILLIAPLNPLAVWHPLLTSLALMPPLRLPVGSQTLSQPHWEYYHPSPSLLNLHLWHLEMLA